MQAHDVREPSVAEAYDLVAEKYDGLFNGALAFAENQFLFRRLIDRHHLSGRVLDVGCGTGLLLDWCRAWVPPSCYTGFDISEGMVLRAREKFPTYTFGVHDASEGAPGFLAQWDSIVSLFAAPSYFDLECFLSTAFNALARGGRVAVVPFGLGERFIQDYRVVDSSGTEVPHKQWSAAELHAALEGAGFEQVEVVGLTSHAFHEAFRAVREGLAFLPAVEAYAQDFRALQLDPGEAIFLLGTGVKAR